MHIHQALQTKQCTGISSAASVSETAALKLNVLHWDKHS